MSFVIATGRDGQWMSMDKFLMHNNAIKEAMIVLEASRSKYKEVLKNSGGNYKEAQAASDAMTGGYCKFWDKLCNDGHIVCMVVTCPAAADHNVRKENEESLRQTIMKIDAHLSTFFA